MYDCESLMSLDKIRTRVSTPTCDDNKKKRPLISFECEPIASASNQINSMKLSSLFNFNLKYFYAKHRIPQPFLINSHERYISPNNGKANGCIENI